MPRVFLNTSLCSSLWVVGLRVRRMSLTASLSCFAKIWSILDCQWWSISIVNLVGFRMLPERFSWRRRQTLNVEGTVSQTGDSEPSISSQLSLLPVWECSVASQPLCNPTPAPATRSTLHRPLPKCELKEIFLQVAFVQYFTTAMRQAISSASQVSPSPLAFTHAPFPTPRVQYLFHVDAVWAESWWCTWKAGGKPPRLQPFPGVAAESYIARLFLSVPSE